ncbi:hypothetical protein EOE67_03180 [Rheinheimera riviphila]|uniref:DUF1579 domain-containing protein n=1 Tax=Rheinheimera riviphila TaxID=1834037 RepID=A0A437R3H2_9GAMM|nr:hypothetical protein [Rheinheimera riviphila]RVU41217.1 hypothetical protein EOE67_03180 [Rheinheimera riviphila]
MRQSIKVLLSCALAVQLFVPAVVADPVAATPASVQQQLAPELEFFRPLLGIVWQADMGEQNGKKQTDRAFWQRALNGQAIKTIHSINDGAYGGETMIFWDKKKKSLAYYYFTTAGFYTHGVMSFDVKTKVLTAEEQVENNANGITAVRSKSVLAAESLAVSSEYLQHGKWVPGHTAVYHPTKDGQVRFQ